MAHRRLIVISDLHLGGRPDSMDSAGRLIPGTSICSATTELACFFQWLTDEISSASSIELELVINGDIFDFLCELEGEADVTRTHWYSNEDLALHLAKNLEEKYLDSSDQSPLRALQQFVAHGGNLTLLIGNHDVELSYPRVRAWLHGLLDVGGGKVRFIYDGEAYVVGDVLIEHGNRYDPWNVIDHNTLRQDRSLMSRGELRSEDLIANRHSFVPPAGSYMVAYVFNQLKQQYRFVDLLKPETELVLPLLLTVCPASTNILQSLVAVSADLAARLDNARGVGTGSPYNSGHLNAAQTGIDNLGCALQAVLGNDASLFQAEIHSASTLAMNGQLSWAGDRLSDLRDTALVFGRKLTTSATFASLLVPGSRESTLKRLRAALIKLNSSDPFALDLEAENYLRAAKRIASNGRFSVVVFGHTHLPKHVVWQDQITNREKVYINTGTWADVMRIPEQALKPTDNPDNTVLAQFANDLATNNYRHHVRRYLTYAEIQLVGQQATSARLWQFHGTRSPKSPVDMGKGKMS